MERHTIIQGEGAQPAHFSFHAAAYTGDVAQVMDPLQQGSKVSSPSFLHSGRHALHLAASGGHVSLVDELLKKGADPDACDHQGFRPLHIAAQRGFVDVVELLKTSGAKLEVQTKSGLQPVHLAAGSGHVPMLKQLQNYRCNLAALDLSSATPLHHAAQHGKLEAVKWLIEAGVSLDIKDEEEKSAADRARENKYYQVAELLTTAISGHPKKPSETTVAWKKRSSQLASSCTTQLTSPVNIPHLLHNISDKLSPTINRSPAKFQISSSEISSANSPSSSPRLQDSHSSQVPQPSSPHQSLTQVYQSNGTFTSTLKLPTSTDATTPSSPPQFPFDTHPPNTSSSDTGMSSIPSCNLSIQISDTFIPSSSTTLSLPSQSDPLPSTAFHATSSTSSQWETKPVKNDKKKTPNRGCPKISMKKTSAVIKERLIQVLKNLLVPFTCEDGTSNQHSKTGKVHSSNKYTDVSQEGCSLGHGGVQLAAMSPPHGQSQQEAPVMELRVQAAEQPYPDGPNIYSCCTNPRGLVLILNNKSFKNSQHPTRFGSEFDTINLENVYQQMGYQVETRWDLNRQDTLDYFCEMSKSPILRHVSCLFVFIMSHGDGPRRFLTYDLATVTLDEIQSCFLDKPCPNLKGKPKVFFSHFCRGSDEEIRPTLSPEAKREAYRDMLCIFSSTEGFQAYRDDRLGTPSVRALCQTLAQHSHHNKLCEVIKEFQRLYDTMEGATTPEVQDFTFNKDFFLNPIGKRRIL